jgi:hypothetical protein
LEEVAELALVLADETRLAAGSSGASLEFFGSVFDTPAEGTDKGNTCNFARSV